MATYEYETSVNLNGNYKEKPPRKEGYTTYVKGSVDVTTAGEYLITYTFIKEDPFDSITETRLVTVVDTYDVDDSPAPEVYLNGDTVVTIGKGSSWTDPGAYAIDPKNGTNSNSSFIDVKTVLPIDGDTWASQPIGSYSILYYAVSGSNRIGFATRTVSIVAVSVSGSLNGCSKLYIEYPSSGGAISYVGQNYTGSGNIVFDAGYSVSGSNYTLEIGVKPEDGEFYLVSEDKAFFTADSSQTKTYEIYYKITGEDGYERTSIREVVMMKDGETDPTVLSGLEFQKNSSDGCADRDPIVTEDELLKNDLDEYGDSVFDDPVLNPTPTDVPDPVVLDSLYLFCAGKTAFSGGLMPSTWSSNPGKIPNQIVESWYAPASTRTGWDNFFTTAKGAVMPGENEQTTWTNKGTAIIWQLHKIHSETKVTYSYGYGLGSAPILYSTWEPYYENGVRVGDIFYGFYGAHIFLQSEGWSARIIKIGVSFQEFISGERKYIGMAPYSFTRITEALKAMHVAKISAPNIPEESVFQDDNKQTLSNGGILHSVPLFRGIDAKIAAGGTGVAGEDMISLSWRSLGGVTDVSKYCDYTVPQVQLPLYCNTVFDKVLGYDGSNSFTYDYEASRVGPVPGTLFELTWTDNPSYGTFTSSLYKYSLIHPNQSFIEHTWYLAEVAIDHCVYIKSNGSDQRSLVIDPSDPTKNKFEGLLATYSFNRAYAPAFYSPFTTSKEGIKYITNFDAGDRIPATSPNSSLSSSFTYYNSLAFGGPTTAWVSPSSGSSGTYSYLWQFGSFSSNTWTLYGDPVDPC